MKKLPDSLEMLHNSKEKLKKLSSNKLSKKKLLLLRKNKKNSKVGRKQRLLLLKLDKKKSMKELPESQKNKEKLRSEKP